MNIETLYDTLFPNNDPIAKYEFLEIVTANKDLLNAPISFESEDYVRRIYIFSQWGHYLYDNNTYSKAILYFDEAAQLWEQIPDLYPPLLQNDNYRRMCTYRAMCNYYLKNMKLAKDEFSLLARQYPQDEQIKGWLKGTNDDMRRRIINTGYNVIAGLFILHMLIPERQQILRLSIFTLALLIYVSITWLNYSIKKRKTG